MWDILFNVGAAVLGALIGYGIGSLISNYIDRAIDWFNDVWSGLRRVKRAVGILIMKGKRLYKHLIALLNNDEIEAYEDTSDEGVEIDRGTIDSKILKALDEDGYIPVKVFE